MPTAYVTSSALALALVSLVPAAAQAQAQAPARVAEGQFPDSPAAAEPEPAPPPGDAPPTPEPKAPVEPAAPGPSPEPPPAEAAPVAAAPALPAPRYDVAPAVANRPSKFFSSLALGGGYFYASSGGSDDKRTFSGGTVGGQLVIGGRIGRSRIATLGGVYLRDQVVGLSAEDEVVDGDEPDLEQVAFGLWILGLFSDFALQQAPGLHFQVVAGLSGLEVSEPGRNADNPFGLAINVGVGYDFGVSRHLALGALLRATYAPLDVQESRGTTVTSAVPALLLTATTR